MIQRLVMLGVGLVCTASATAQCQWQWLRSDPPDDTVRAMAFLPNGDLVVGGIFQNAGAAPASCVARWNGHRWSPLGAGIGGGIYPEVHAMTTRPDGTLIVGGNFTRAGETAVLEIAAWNGHTWSSIGDLNGVVFGLTTLSDGSVVATGAFASAGGVTVNRVARWDGSQWHALGGGVGDTAYAVEELPGGDLVVGGRFSTAGGVTARAAARWDGTAWTPMDFPGTGLPATVRDFVQRANGDLVAAVEYDPSNHVAYRWNGSAWVLYGSLAANPSGRARGVFEDPAGNLIVVGNMTLQSVPIAMAKWDGTAWTAINGPDAPVEATIRAPNGRFLIGGQFLNAGGNATGRITVWDGLSAFGTLGGGPSAPIGDLGLTAEGHLLIAPLSSPFASTGGMPMAGVPELSAGGWRSLGTGLQRRVGHANGRTLAWSGGQGAEWNGTAWQALRAIPGWPNQPGPFLSSDADIPEDGRGIFISGWYFAFQPPFANVCFGLDASGSAWTSVFAHYSTPPLSIPPSLSFRDGLAILEQPHATSSSFYFQDANHTGTTDGDILCSALLPDGTRFIGGRFTTVNGTTANRVARLVAGQPAQPLGAGMNDAVHDLIVLPDGSLVAGGAFTQAGGMQARYLARWDGSAWSELAGGMRYGAVSDLALLPDGTLAVGGSFYGPGDGQYSRYLAFLGNTCAAAVQTVGQGCAGTGGLLQASHTSMPWLCTTFRSQCTGFSASAIGFAVLGFDSPGTPLPLLHPVGGPGCNLWSGLASAHLALPTNGVATAQWGMPLTPDWLGSELFHQYLQLELDIFGGITAIQSSNGLRLTLGVP